MRAGRKGSGNSQHTIEAMLHTSVLAPHFAPRITSGERYCLVWMSFVKWWFTQQALPRSAILTLMMSNACISSAFLFSPVAEGEPGLSSEIPETSLVRISAVFSRCFCLSSPASLPGLGEGSFDLLPVVHGQDKFRVRLGRRKMGQ